MEYLIALLLTGAGSFPAEAHRQRTEGLAVDGISIPSLTHGQMAVIADNLSAIRSLADQESPGDLVMRRLRDYANLQSFACLWGMVPGSISDEASPFNECAHAYLAGAQALLMHLRQMPGVYHKSVEALVAKIELEMLQNNTSLALCRYSDEPFNTDAVIWPRWTEVPFHPPTMGTLLGLLTLIGGATLWSTQRSSRLQA